MRMLLDISFPHAKFNAAVKDGSVGQKMGKIIEALKPEAVYFTERKGKRGATMIVNLDDPAQIPSIAEPFFLEFEADVKLRVVMSPDELKRGNLEELGKKWG